MSPYNNGSDSKHYSQADYENGGYRGRSRSPERRTRERSASIPPPSIQPPTGPRALAGKAASRFPPTESSFRPPTEGSVEYQFVLPTSNLVRFLIGPRGDRSRRIKNHSNVGRVTFSDSDEKTRNDPSGKGTGVCFLRGTPDQIRRALECIAMIVAEEIDIEISTGNRGNVEWGDYKQWTAWDDSNVGTFNRDESFGQYKPAHPTYENSYRPGPRSPPRRSDIDMSMHTSEIAAAQGYAAAPYIISQRTWEEKDRREKEKGPSGSPDVVIPIPPAAVATLIGPKGSMIREINTATGAYCRVDRSGPGLPLLNIYGEPHLIPKVMELVDDLVSRCEPSWTGGMNQPNQVSLIEYPRGISPEPSYSRASESRQPSYRDDRRNDRDDRVRGDDRETRHEREEREDRIRREERKKRDEREQREEQERREARERRDERERREQRGEGASSRFAGIENEDDLMDLFDMLPVRMVDNAIARRERRATRRD